MTQLNQVILMGDILRIDRGETTKVYLSHYCEKDKQWKTFIIIVNNETQLISETLHVDYELGVVGYLDIVDNECVIVATRIDNMK